MKKLKLFFETLLIITIVCELILLFGAFITWDIEIFKAAHLQRTSFAIAFVCSIGNLIKNS